MAVQMALAYYFNIFQFNNSLSFHPMRVNKQTNERASMQATKDTGKMARIKETTTWKRNEFSTLLH
jgi:hypothetical protein